MPHFRRLGAGLLAVAALAVSACQDDSTPTSPDAGPASARVQTKQGPELPSAAEFARQVPGFGGFFLSRDGAPSVYLTRGSSRAPAERLLAGYLGARGLSAASVRVLEGRYGWAQLQRWQEVASSEALAVPGAASRLPTTGAGCRPRWRRTRPRCWRGWESGCIWSGAPDRRRCWRLPCWSWVPPLGWW